MSAGARGATPLRPANHWPRLRHRPLRAADLAESMALLPPHLELDADERVRLAHWWSRKVDAPGMSSGVIEDTALPAGQRIQGWGVSIIAPPALCDLLQLQRAPCGHLARRTYTALLDGAVALPDDREIGRWNASGELVLLILHFTLQHFDLADPYALKVVASANDSFRAFHDGYQWRAMYYENAATAAPIALQSGFQAGHFTDEAALAALPPERRPALFMLTREQALAQMPGTTARNCFEWQPPRFRFNAAQRRLLSNSLFDENDEALMALLDVSVHGLKKLWRGIYERIEAAEPEFFGESASADEGKRGPEKRRQVLAYVRQRPEELRPWSSA
ncbi:MAG TPA: hypothetical protein VLJ62_21545 [Burkholderiaceae bacterium]|nr:hypothetical protein [Burkholderiaceae bacterium]